MNKVFDNYLFDAFANASDSIYVYVTDIESGITKWSQKAVDYFGLPDEYLSNVKDTWIQYVHPDDRETYINDITAVFTAKSTTHNCQYRVRNRYGEYVWVECRGSIIYDGLGAPKVFAGIMMRIDNAQKYDELTHFLSGHEFFRYALHDSGTIMMIGIDKLRIINSQHGVLYGNRVLRYLSDVLRELLPSAIIFRYWGDDFLVCEKGISSQSMSDIFLKISNRCATPDIRSGLSSFRVSAGIVEYMNGDLQEHLVSYLETSLTYAKERASHVVVYSSEIMEAQNRMLLMSELLVKSIQNDFKGFYLVFQPILSGKADRVLACEALLRWDPSNTAIGVCYPDEFIPLLEKSGSIIDVGYFVMRESIRRIAKWQSRYPGLKVSINVSYHQLEDPLFATSIVEEIANNHLDPSCVIVELTENVFVNDIVLIEKTFGFLKEHGVCIALDDFGRGNSSLWMLHNYKFDYVKLDQAFVRTLNRKEIDYVIIQSTIMMCQCIGSHAIAEGIENQEILDYISAYGFSGLQGFLFSKPLLPESFEQYLDSFMNQST